MEIKLINDILEISEITSDYGYIIHIFPDGIIHLYEVTPMKEQFVGQRPNLYDAIMEGKSWT
jgi:hypothetical protein